MDKRAISYHFAPALSDLEDMHLRKKLQKNTNSSIRIIAGDWRGRKLPVAEVEGLRPTGDRIRETLFNWLQLDIRGARCLDLFAGTGALGLEALSRGASKVIFCELNTTAQQQLQANLATLNANNGELKRTAAGELLNNPQGDTPFDIVFIDPPFAENLWNTTLEALLHPEANWLSEHALIYLEYPKNTAITLPATWRIRKTKTTGQVTFTLLERE